MSILYKIIYSIVTSLSSFLFNQILVKQAILISNLCLKYCVYCRYLFFPINAILLNSFFLKKKKIKLSFQEWSTKVYSVIKMNLKYLFNKFTQN